MYLTILENDKDYPQDRLSYDDGDYTLSINKATENEQSHLAFATLDSVKVEKYNNETIKDDTLDFRSDKKTALLFVPGGSFHLIVDFFSKIINLCETESNVELVLNFSFHNNDTESSFDKSFMKFLFNFLNDHNITYKIIKDWTTINKIVLNNFILFTIGNINSSPITHKLFLKYFKNCLVDTNQKPFRKVYLNRKDYSDRHLYDTRLTYNRDNRIENEELLEEYLNNNGFECISLENKFNTFEEQVNYFYSVKTLVAVTSAGLTNCLYMQPGSVMIELVTPQVVNIATKNGDSLANSIHSLWQPLTSVKEIDHISISNFTRNATDVLDKIQNIKYLQDIFEG